MLLEVHRLPGASSPNSPLAVAKEDRDQVADMLRVDAASHTAGWPLRGEPVYPSQPAGLPVLAVRPDVRDIIRLYPQPRGRPPSVEYIPLPYRQGRDGIGRQ